MQTHRSDIVAAWATGIGVGFVGLMLAWLIGQRITAALWGPPVGPTVALFTAIVVGIGAAVFAGMRLVRTVRKNHIADESPKMEPKANM